jgi:hypothetical protein
MLFRLRLQSCSNNESLRYRAASAAPDQQSARLVSLKHAFMALIAVIAKQAKARTQIICHDERGNFLAVQRFHIILVL